MGKVGLASKQLAEDVLLPALLALLGLLLSFRDLHDILEDVVDVFLDLGFGGGVRMWLEMVVSLFRFVERLLVHVGVRIVGADEVVGWHHPVGIDGVTHGVHHHALHVWICPHVGRGPAILVKGMIRAEQLLGSGKISVLEDGSFLQEDCNLCPFVSQEISSLAELLFHLDCYVDALEGEEEVGPVLGVYVFAHVLGGRSCDLLDYWLNHLHLHGRRGHGREAQEDDWNVGALPLELVVVADHKGPAGRVREEDPEALRGPQPLEYFLCPFVGSRCLADLLVLHERKSGECLYILNYAVVGHELGQICLVEMVGNAPNPELPDEDVARLEAEDLLVGLMLQVLRGILRVGVDREVALVGHRPGGSVAQVLAWVGLGVPFAVVVVLDVHLPGGMVLLELGNDLVGEGLVSPHCDEGVAEEVEFPAGVVTLDDSGWGQEYLTYLREARGYRMFLSVGYSVSRGSCPI